MNSMSGTPSQDLKDGNKLEFVVRRTATKPEIKKAFEERFEAKVEKVNVKYMKDGKHAIVKLKDGYSAEDIGMRIGIF
jgi:large subunit ribosomal protein L23